MWVLVFFDLPTETKKQRKAAQKHVKRVKTLLPEQGYVGILKITDKQFETMELFYSRKEKEKPLEAQQLQLF